MDKNRKYNALVQKRKQCRLCLSQDNADYLINPSTTPHDVGEIGHWSIWQANLEADILVIGQDWGDYPGFMKGEGKDSNTNPTNVHLRDLLKTIQVDIGQPTNRDGRNGIIFLTNTILCMKNNGGGMQGKIQKEWGENCGSTFLLPLIDMIKPKIIITLGGWAYLTMREQFSISRKSFRQIMIEYERPDFHPIRLANSALYFPMYHCGQRVINSQKGIGKQMHLWQKIKF